MTHTQAKQRITKLKILIEKYRHSRLVFNKELISPEAEDSLKKELFDLEQQFPNLVTADSSTQRVGGEPLKEFKKVEHEKPMLSFNDAFGPEDMAEWEARFEKLHAAASHGGYYCELKIDGLAIELIYEKESFQIGATRGNGRIGEDVTQNLKTVEAIPLELLPESTVVKNLAAAGLSSFAPAVKTALKKKIIVRGEVFLNHSDFQAINRAQKKEGLKEYANPRNLAAGTIRQLDPKITASRKLDSFAYDMVTDVGQTTHEQVHLILAALGFKTNSHNKLLADLDGVQKFRDHWETAREKLAYEIDGVVVIVNDLKSFDRLGVIGKAPRGAIAYKFSPRESQTIVDDIIVQVGRTGVLTPVAVLKPVTIGGVTVSRATLHNLDEIKRLGVKKGDTVIVGRAGDVIPDVKKVLTDLRTGAEKEFHMPKQCPICGEKIEKIADQVAYRCVNSDCPAIRREAIYHFVSRNALDIDGVGPKIIDQLMDAALIKDPADLFTLEKDDLLNLDRFAEVSATNVIDSISRRTRVPLSKFIYALGIPHVGEETAFALARRFQTFDAFRKATSENLEHIEDIGPVVSRSISHWFGRSYHMKLLEKFKKTGLKILPEKLASQKLAGKTFVLTGTLEHLSREQAKEKIRNHGGDVSASVSAETDYVVMGSEPGTKYEKAKKLGITIIDENKFLEIIAEK